jgi:hypothetical protein
MVKHVCGPNKWPNIPFLGPVATGKKINRAQLFKVNSLKNSALKEL